MRALLTSLTLVSAISLSSAAFAATATGTIQSMNSKAMTLTLNKGRSYMLPAGFKAANLKVGEKVKVAYHMVGKKHEATTVTPLM